MADRPERAAAKRRGVLARLRLLRENLGGRILLLSLATCLGVFMLMSLALFFIQQRSVTRSLAAERASMCAEANSIAENACAYLRGVADYFSGEYDAESLMRRRGSDAAEVAEDMSSFFRPQGYLLDIILFDAEGAPVQYMTIDDSRVPQSQRGNPVFQSLVSRRQVYAWQYTAERSGTLFKQDNSPRVSVWRVIKGSNNSTVLGAIVVSIDARRLLGYEVAYNSGYRRSFMMLDTGADAVISNYTRVALSPASQDEITRAIGGGDEGRLTMPIDGADAEIYYCRVADTPMYTLYIPEGGGIGGMSTPILVALVTFACFLLAVIPLMHYINRYLTRPLERLTHEMDLFSQGDYSASFPTASGDTIGHLGDAFNHMVRENKKLVEQTYGARLRAREAELSVLQSQINPHFIYNLINALQWSAISKGEHEIANTAHAMGQVLRISLNRGDALIPISRECELIAGYLALQKTRYGERLCYDIDCAPDAGAALIPKLIIQPLVENSVVHGAEKSIETIHVHVTVSLNAGRVLIEVEDDGAGIPESVLRLLPDRCVPENLPPDWSDGQPDAQSENARLFSGSGSGFAIHNIYERLMLFYGEGGFEFNIHSELNFGTYVTIDVPAQPPRREEGADVHADDRG